MSEALEAAKKEKQIQARWVSTTLLTATPTDTINHELLRAVSFDLKKVPAIVFPDIETMSETGDSELNYNQEPNRTGSPQATAVMYTKSCPEATKAVQTSSRCCSILSKPSTTLPTLATTRVFHLPIDDTHVGWLNHFLTNTDIPNDVHPKYQQCRVVQGAPKVYLCPGDVLPLPTAEGCFQGM